ncbi:amidohydrolase family protein [Gammaproteobacteria bacterium]|nr:amidohydrolase family protein [Gammaproteobacteria bacterium]|tara:strand:- start:6983 stop:8686 length:1704 start_codon:yes stop_codon:yes gene_type:complete
MFRLLIITFATFSFFSSADISLDRIIIPKQLVTLDASNANSDAVMVRGDRIHVVGMKDDLMMAYPDAALDYSHANDVMVPGFIEHHIHPLLAAITMNSEILAIDDWIVPNKQSIGVRDRAGYFKRLKELEINIEDADTPLISWGFHHYFHGKLTKDDLDAISSERPILIIHRSFHEFIMNTKALELFKINKEDLKDLNLEEQKLANYEQGHFSERGLIMVMPKIMQYLAAPQRIIKGLETTEKYIHEKGITLIANPGAMYNKSIQGAKNYVLGDKDTPFNSLFIPSGLYMLEHFDQSELIEEAEALLKWGQGRVQYLPKQVKLFTDGAMYSQNMVLRDGYLDGHQGVWLMEEKIFKDTFKIFWDAGYQIHIHQNGDSGLDRILDAVKENMQSNPREDHRTTIVHFGYSAFDQVKSMKDLGIIVSANPYYVTALSDLYSKVGVGYSRSQEMVRLGDVARAKIPLSLHSDMPMAPASPLLLMHAAVNRINYAGKVAGPSQRISPLEALMGVTLNAAYTLKLEMDYGSISQGKYANFTLLEENPLEVDPSKIKDIKVNGTIVEGREFPLH